MAFDSGVLGGWMRTGESFKAYAKGSNPSSTVNPVCRFYSPPIRQINDSDISKAPIPTSFRRRRVNA